MTQRSQRAPAPPAENRLPVSPADPRWVVGLGLMLVAAVFLAYRPVWGAGFIWDDDGHLTRPDLRSLAGLARIWTEPGATQQYYPLLHSVFWLLGRVFGQEPTAYHLLNIGLHAANALLVWRILGRLRIPGAALAAGIFALHPVMVESVAWVSEIKNTLSALFYLGAALAWLRYDETRRPGWLAGAFVLFVLALLTKTVTATLPAALLVVVWWQRGRLDWRREVWPLLPFFAAGLAAGMFTAAVERHLIGASGGDFNFSLVERGLIAGRALWFYAGKLIWPADLVFIYPRWAVSGAEAGQYVWPLAAFAAGAALLWLARRWRGPLAGALFFGGTLFPALGFVNVYPFQFSFVADHFQYLASLGLIVPVAAAWALLPAAPRATLAVVGALVLGGLTFVQSRAYADVETLYTVTLARNPGAWLAQINLGNERLKARRYAEAIPYYEAALRLKPGQPKAYFNLGTAYAALGRMPEAIGAFEAALQSDPDYARAHFNLGSALASAGRPAEAAAHMRQAVRLMPDSADAHRNLGQVLLDTGHAAEAAAEFRAALQINPADRAARELLDSVPADARGNR